MNPANTSQPALLWAVLGSFPSSQKDYEDLAEGIRKIYLDPASSLFERLPMIWPNLGASQAQIAERMRAASGTFLRDQVFGTHSSFADKIKYFCNECPAGYYYIVGRMNRLCSDYSITKWARTTPRDWHFALNVKKSNDTQGIIVTISTSQESIECHAEALTEENMRYYFSDVYLSFYYSHLPSESEETKAVAEKIRVPSKSRRLREHRERQLEKRKNLKPGVEKHGSLPDWKVSKTAREFKQGQGRKRVMVLKVNGNLRKYV